MPKIDYYQSRFDFIREHAKSQWHFDCSRKTDSDLIHLGRIVGDWQHGVEQLKYRERAAWRPSTSPDAAQSHWRDMHHHDLQSWGYSRETIEHETHVGDPPPRLKKIPELLGLIQCHIDINRQRPGHMTPLHTDTRNHEYGLTRIFDGDFSSPNLARILIALTDWDWGHYCLIGNQVWHQWQRGDMIMIPWQVLHATANCGSSDRYFLSLSGTRTKKFEDVISGRPGVTINI